MPEVMTPAEVEALAATAKGLRELDAAVARALGWEPPEDIDPFATPHGELDRGVWHRDGKGYWEFIKGVCPAPPPYASHAPDAPDRWRWRGEMIEALYPDMSEYQADRLTIYYRRAKNWNIIGELAYPTGAFINVMGDTLDIALVKALAAAGRLRKENA